MFRYFITIRINDKETFIRIEILNIKFINLYIVDNTISENLVLSYNRVEVF